MEVYAKISKIFKILKNNFKYNNSTKAIVYKRSKIRIKSNFSIRTIEA